VPDDNLMRGLLDDEVFTGRDRVQPERPRRCCQTSFVDDK
jgi:hypothetical protein